MKIEYYKNGNLDLAKLANKVKEINSKFGLQLIGSIMPEFLKTLLESDKLVGLKMVAQDVDDDFCACLPFIATTQAAVRVVQEKCQN